MEKLLQISTHSMKVKASSLHSPRRLELVITISYLDDYANDCQVLIKLKRFCYNLEHPFK